MGGFQDKFFLPLSALIILAFLLLLPSRSSQTISSFTPYIAELLISPLSHNFLAPVLSFLASDGKKIPFFTCFFWLIVERWRTLGVCVFYSLLVQYFRVWFHVQWCREKEEAFKRQPLSLLYISLSYLLISAFSCLFHLFFDFW